MESGYTRTGGGLSRAGFRGGSVSPTYPPDGEATCPPIGDTILPYVGMYCTLSSTASTSI